MTENHNAKWTRQRMTAYFASAAVLNAPFVLCHPGWPVVDCPWIRCLAVGLMLFLIPGLPWLGVLTRRGWLDGFQWLGSVVVSLAVMLAAVAAVDLAGWPLSGAKVWNLVWIATNLGVGINLALGGPPGWGIRLRRGWLWLGGCLFVAAHLLFFFGATEVVPPLEDQDFQLITCGYGLLTRFEPLHASHLDTCYQFSHPPLAYWYTAASFLYFDRLPYLEYYDAASRRARDARRGVEFRWFDGTVGGLTQGTVEDHRVIGRDGGDYMVTPPLNDGSRRIPVWLLENAVMFQYFERDPQVLAARTSHVFLAALTVALLGCWIRELGGTWLLATLIPLAYATSPEVFVRSAYAGHFATTQFAVLMLLMALECRPAGSRRGPWRHCLLAGAFLGLANHKLVLLPLAVVVWKLFCSGEKSSRRRWAGALWHPAAIGFAAGTALFWLWGLALDPAEFWQSQVRIHALDRLMHHNPQHFGGYPGRVGLWIEFCRHTGYVLLPLGIAALAALVLSRSDRAPLGDRGGQHPGRSPSTAGLWLVWTLLTALVFSLVDWRQTKHLMPLLLPLHLAPARWAVRSLFRRTLLGVVLVGLMAWNLHTLWQLAKDFTSFPVAPTW